MKFLRYNDNRLGCLTDTDEVVDITEAVGPAFDLMVALVSRYGDLRDGLMHLSTAGPRLRLDALNVQAPLLRPVNIVGMATNYLEDGTWDAPAPINAFLKSSGSLIGPGETMVLPDAPATVFEAEAELCVIVGRRMSKVSADEAKDGIFGYCNFIDGSARGLPPDRNVFFQMKARDTFAPIGPWVVTADEISDPHDLAVELKINGAVKQSFSTSDMAHDIFKCLSWLSHVMTLQPGDIVATGTNHRGLSAVQDGDVIDLSITGLGTLTINVADQLKRSWPRETRLELSNAFRKQGGTPPPTGVLAKQTAGKYA